MPIEPIEQAAPQRGNIQRNQCDSQWQHPETQKGKESKQSGNG
jgi:hypothetical protein